MTSISQHTYSIEHRRDTQEPVCGAYWPSGGSRSQLFHLVMKR